jgi:hypothetical protein
MRAARLQINTKLRRDDEATKALVTIGDQDDSRLCADGFASALGDSDAARLRRSRCDLGRLFGGGNNRIVGGGGNDYRITGAGRTRPVAGSGRIRSNGGEGRDNKKLLHDEPPFDIEIP